ncbi:MAG: hypothetical protein A2511_02065 [Deltaproteobacteria bacterium RIFOXYD12_FULL_50_9]|nr:MAG: hypothetical protein A2511_02065 [Deltaproteobacteria bacterium RIFOXYD12_FULL_50_9]
MRNVDRPNTPKSLENNAPKWTKKLLDAIAKHHADGTPIDANLYKAYSKKDVLATLKTMYSDDEGLCFCCYCESEIDKVDFPHIEHRKPKAKDLFPESTFDWNNLHLACQKCNIAKGDKYDVNSPILDSVADLPIKTHLSYKVSTTKGIYRETLSSRGVTTVKHADLDRKTLRDARLKVFLEVTEAIREILRLANDPRTYTYKKILRDKCAGEYGSLIEWLLDDYGIIA